MAQWIKGLPCKHKDLSSNPQNPCKTRHGSFTQFQCFYGKREGVGRGREKEGGREGRKERARKREMDNQADKRILKVPLPLSLLYVADNKKRESLSLTR